MRDEQTVLTQIVTIARTDDRIRAVCLNGSRANPKITPDAYQDYDITFYVRETESYRRNPGWIDVFGDRLILQMPNTMDLGDGYPAPEAPRLTYLMLFTDHVRIDLNLQEIPGVSDHTDSLTKVLYDKDGLFAGLPPPNERDYLTRPPTEAQFLDCCNEFWWVSTYVAKGLLRQEFFYAKEMLEGPVRAMFLRMIGWHAAQRHDFTVNLGTSYRYLPRYITPGEYEDILSTFPGASLTETRTALLTMITLFDRYAGELGRDMGYSYDAVEAGKVLRYLGL